MKPLEFIHEQVADLLEGKGFLANVSLSSRSCRCSVLSLGFEGLKLVTFEKKKREVVGIFDAFPFRWNLIYISPFPGTDYVSKISARLLCPHCLENYMLEKVIGMNTIVIFEKLH